MAGLEVYTCLLERGEDGHYRGAYRGIAASLISVEAEFIPTQEPTQNEGEQVERLPDETHDPIRLHIGSQAFDAVFDEAAGTWDAGIIGTTHVFLGHPSDLPKDCILFLGIRGGEERSEGWFNPWFQFTASEIEQGLGQNPADNLGELLFLSARSQGLADYWKSKASEAEKLGKELFV